MEQAILKSLKDLESQILTMGIPAEARQAKEWGGADVIIKKEMDEQLARWLGEQPSVISLQITEPRRRAVLTEHSRELSWLFYQLRDVFSGAIDHVSKYDFYGLLAQSAMNHIEKNERQTDAKALLLEVLDTAEGLVSK